MMKSKLTPYLMLCLLCIAVLWGCGGGSNNANNAKRSAAAEDSVTQPYDDTSCPTVSPTDTCLNADCCEPACTTTIVYAHCIKKSVFDAASCANRTIFTKAQIQSLLTGLNCAEADYVAITYNSGTARVELTPTQGNGTPPSSGYFFSVPHLSGIFTVFNTATHIDMFTTGAGGFAYRIRVNNAVVAFGDDSAVYP